VISGIFEKVTKAHLFKIKLKNKVEYTQLYAISGLILLVILPFSIFFDLKTFYEEINLT